MKAAAINVGNPTHAICQGCMLRLEVSRFPVRNDRSGRYRPYCKECAADVERARYAAYKRTSPFKSKLIRAKSRSQYLRVWAAELDRFKPELGYVIGNVSFLSRRANRLKNNTTTSELEQLLNWMTKYENG